MTQEKLGKIVELLAVLLIVSVVLNLLQFSIRLKTEKPMHSGYVSMMYGDPGRGYVGWCSDDGENWWKARKTGADYTCYRSDKQFWTTKER